MRNLAVWFCVFMFLCSATLAVELDPEKFMPVNEIKPGMKGVGKTVFEGTKIEEFQVEVLDVVKNFIGPKHDIIWVLCSGGPLEETGLLSGMSGSPIYIDGRMIGAISYRLGLFAKQPLAGVTPIASMLQIFEHESESSSSERTGLIERSLLEKTGQSFHDLLKPESEMSALLPEDEPASIVPIQTPVMMSGFDPRVISEIVPLLKGSGMVPVQGGGTSSLTGSEKVVPLEPGSVMGVQFVKGDASAYAYGTVTYTDGDKVLAFGHPLMGMGRTNLPVANGRVVLLQSSMMESSKYAAPIDIMGSLAFDSEYGIMGIVGKQPEFIPVKIRVNSREYNFEVAKHRLFSPTYIFAVAANTIYSEIKSVGDYTIRTHTEINLKGYPKISTDNVFSGMSPDIVASEFAAPIQVIMQNSFEEGDVESVSLDIAFQEERINARIDGVRIDRETVRPGDSVEVTLFLTPYLDDTVVKRFEVTVPEDMPEGISLLRISDAGSSYSWEKARAPMKSQIRSLSQIVRLIQEEENNSDIIVELFTPKLGVTIGDQELPALPLTTFSVMNSAKETGGSDITRGTTFLKKRINTEYVISGSATLRLIVDWDAPY